MGTYTAHSTTVQVGQVTAYPEFIKLRVSIMGTYTAHSTTVQVGQATAYLEFIKLRVSIMGTYTTRYPAPDTIFTACRTWRNPYGWRTTGRGGSFS